MGVVLLKMLSKLTEKHLSLKCDFIKTSFYIKSFEPTSPATMKTKLILSFLCVVSFCFISHARDSFVLSRLGVEKGLSNNHVVGITQDKQGFIWIATDEGLNRYDGHTFKTYFKDENMQGENLTGNELNAIVDDPKLPVIWIATQRAGLNAYNYEKDSFISYRHSEDDSNSIATDDVTTISPAADGGLWVGTYWRGIDHLDPATGKFTHYNPSTVKGMPEASVWSVLDSGDGFLYVAHEHSGFTIIDLKNMTAKNFMPEQGNPNSLHGNNVTCIYKDSLNNIWLGGSGGLALFNPDNETFLNFSRWHPQLNYSVADIHQFSGNELWVAMELGGVATLSLTDSVFSNPEDAECRVIPFGNKENMLSSASIRCLFQDNHSNIWAGSWGGGVNLISSNVPAFGLYGGPEESFDGIATPASSVFTVIFDEDHKMWVGRDGGGLDVYENGRKVSSFSHQKGSLPGDIVQASWKDSDGTLWFGFFNDGAVSYDPATGKFDNIFPDGSNDDVRDIVTGFDGKIILGTSKGIMTYDRTTRKLTDPVKIGNGFVRKVFPVGDGYYLVGTFGSGLVITDKDFRELRRIDVYNGMPSNTVNDIFKSRDGAIWVATGEGLIRFPDILKDSSSFKLFNRASGLGNSHVQAIAQDRSGNIWVSTNGGISCVVGDSVLNYSHRDHVPLGNFLTHSVASDQQGNLYFGSISGLCVFNPVKVLEKMPAPPAVIIELSVLGQSSTSTGQPVSIQLAGKKSIKLKPGQNSFDLSFTTGNFAIAKEVEYSYMLKGFDDRWIMARNGNIATFRDLPAGTYTFMVRTRLRNQDWGDPSEVEIVLPPPFWKSWWANAIYVCIVIFIIGVLLYFYRKRLYAEAELRNEKERHKREQELNDERLRFYTNITHELRTPLTLIVGPLDDLAKDPDLPEKKKRSLSMVHRNAGRLLDLVNRILEFRKTETQNRRLCVRRGNIAATVFEVTLKYKELNRNSNVSVNVQTESGEMDVLYDKEVVTVVLDNLISNALKYTKVGSVDVECHKEDDRIVFSVTDTGLGISPEAVEHIFERYYQESGPHQAAGTGIGLSLVKNLVNLHHGTISVDSKEGKGSKFVVTIPVTDPYPEALHVGETASDTPSADEVDNQAVISDETKPMVLVVDDNEDIRDYIRQSFTDLYDVRCAENGKEGLRLALELMPGIIVSDIMMPEMDGVEMTRQLKSDMRTSHIPIILLTAKAGETDREEGYDSGADSYLTKPFSSSLLQSRINNILLQRMKMTESFGSRPSPVSQPDGESIESKRQKLMKGLNEVDRTFVENLTRIIKENIPHENVDVNFLAAALCISASTLYRKVKAITGISPNEYIRKTKMQMAEELLLSGRFTFSEIAFKVGMNSAAYFRQCFKEEFGMTPTEYLRKVSGEDAKNVHK